jgi:hypothetical protein
VLDSDIAIVRIERPVFVVFSPVGKFFGATPDSLRDNRRKKSLFTLFPSDVV